MSSTTDAACDRKSIPFSALPSDHLSRYRPLRSRFVARSQRFRHLATIRQKLPIGSQALSVVPLARIARTLVAWPNFGIAGRVGFRRGS
jgi:hypothetical protein